MNVKTILVPTDFSAGAEAAFDFATQLARDFEASLIVTHVKPTPEVPGGDDDDVYDPQEPVLHEQLDNVKPADDRVTCEHHMLHGHPSDAILRLAEKESVDLIVIGTHGETNSPKQTMGAVADHVVRGAKCAVLTVKQPAQVVV